MLELPEGATMPSAPLPPATPLRERRRPPTTRPAGPCSRTPSSSGPSATAQPFEDFGPGAAAGPGFEPWNLRVVADPTASWSAPRIVLPRRRGAGYVDQLATRRDQRGRGLAQALLVDAFALARGHGAVRC